MSKKAKPTYKLSASALDILRQMAERGTIRSNTGGFVQMGIWSCWWRDITYGPFLCRHPDRRRFRRSVMERLRLSGFITSVTFGRKIGTMYRRWRITKLGLETVKSGKAGEEDANAGVYAALSHNDFNRQ